MKIWILHGTWIYHERMFSIVLFKYKESASLRNGATPCSKYNILFDIFLIYSSTTSLCAHRFLFGTKFMEIMALEFRSGRLPQIVYTFIYIGHGDVFVWHGAISESQLETDINWMVKMKFILCADEGRNKILQQQLKHHWRKHCSLELFSPSNWESIDCVLHIRYFILRELSVWGYLEWMEIAAGDKKFELEPSVDGNLNRNIRLWIC